MISKMIRKLTVDLNKQEVNDALADMQKKYKLIQVIKYIEKDPTTLVLILLVEELHQ